MGMCDGSSADMNIARLGLLCFRNKTSALRAQFAFQGLCSSARGPFGTALRGRERTGRPPVCYSILNEAGISRDPSKHVIADRRLGGEFLAFCRQNTAMRRKEPGLIAMHLAHKVNVDITMPRR